MPAKDLTKDEHLWVEIAALRSERGEHRDAHALELRLNATK